GGFAAGALEEDLVQKGPRVVWEHWDGVRWADLLPQDRTYGFTRSGYLTFNGPRNFEKRSVFDSEAWWLRARLETGSYDLPPVLRAVLVNAVDAINGVTVEEVLGSSDGSIDQSFTLANAPILAGPELWVLEPDAPTSADRGIILREEGPEAIEPDADGAGSWVRWHLSHQAPRPRRPGRGLRVARSRRLAPRGAGQVRAGFRRKHLAAPGAEGRAGERRCAGRSFPGLDRPGRRLHRQAPADHRP